MTDQSTDERFMRRALELAENGRGCVEPNPMVGCVIVKDSRIIAEGWHRKFGGAHAEVDAIANATGSLAGCTAYVSLEPCCHQGKTPPCTQALISANISRVVVAMVDPFAEVSGQGIQQLEDAGIEVATGILESEAAYLNAPFVKLVRHGRPWLIAKWAMTLDGKIATATGDSQWISNEQCRAIVHEIRGRVDGIMVGIGTAISDDPTLNARPVGPRIATRIIVDSKARLSLDSKLVKSIEVASVLIFCAHDADPQAIAGLEKAGCEVVQVNTRSVDEILVELGKRRMTNVLVEGGSQLLGSLFDANAVDEAHVFIGNQIVGGEQLTAVSGTGSATVSSAPCLHDPEISTIAGNVYVRGRLKK